MNTYPLIKVWLMLQCSDNIIFLWDLGIKGHKVFPRYAHITSVSEEDLPLWSGDMKVLKNVLHPPHPSWFLLMFSHPPHEKDIKSLYSSHQQAFPPGLMLFSEALILYIPLTSFFCVVIWRGNIQPLEPICLFLAYTLWDHFSSLFCTNALGAPVELPAHVFPAS